MRATWLLPIAALSTLAACQKPAELEVRDAWVRLNAVDRQPAAGYFTVKGGASDVVLVSVTSPNAIRSELHETVAGNGGMMAMRPIGRLTIPAGQTIEFKPGGKHVMFFDVNPALKPPRTMPVVLTFADGTTYQTNAKTVLPGA